jgi:heterodisulfide reductase subunit B
MKIRELGVQMFHVGGLVDMTKLTVAFRNFAIAPKDACNVLDSCEQSYVSTVTLDSETFQTNYQLTINRINRTEAARSPTVPVSTMQHDSCNIQLNNITRQLQLVFE